MPQKRVNRKIIIYQMNGIKDTNKAKINVIGHSLGESFEDEEIIIDKKNKGSIKQIMENVYLKMFKCRMTDEFVATQRKLPLLYASIFYERKFVTGYLFSIYVYFEIKSNTSQIKSLDSLLKTELEGKYTIEIVMDEKNEVIEIDKYYGNEEMIKNIMEIIETDELKNIIKIELKKRDEERIQRFGNLMEKRPGEPKYNFDELLKKYEESGNIDDIYE